jgi:hypothetical protein
VNAASRKDILVYVDMVKCALAPETDLWTCLNDEFEGTREKMSQEEQGRNEDRRKKGQIACFEAMVSFLTKAGYQVNPSLPSNGRWRRRRRIIMGRGCQYVIPIASASYPAATKRARDNTAQIHQVT